MRDIGFKNLFYTEIYSLGGFGLFLFLAILFYCLGKIKSPLKYVAYFFLEIAFISLYSGRLINYWILLFFTITGSLFYSLCTS